MTRDYANKRRARSRIQPGKGRAAFEEKSINFLPSWAWMLLGIFLGLISSSLVFWQYQNNQSPKITSHKLPESTEKKPASKKARFDFYHVLPTLKEEEVSAAPQETTPQNAPYILQAGSFRQMAQAQELKAQLTLFGLEPNIQTIKITSQDIWYRVYLGPFENRDKALMKQKQLEQAYQIHSLVLKYS